MISDTDKYKEYVVEHPDQVFVNQENILGSKSKGFSVEEIGVAAVVHLDDVMNSTSGSWTRHQECIRDCISWTASHYQKNTNITPGSNVFDLVEEMYDIAEKVENEFVAIEVFLPFIRSVKHNSELLESLHENLFVEAYFKVILEGPQQNRFWISQMS